MKLKNSVVFRGLEPVVLREEREAGASSWKAL